MRNILLSFIMLFVSGFSVKVTAQIHPEKLQPFQLTKEEYKQFKQYLISKGLKTTDTIFIKYDFNKENCWNSLDDKDDVYIKRIIGNFQNYISDFNKTFKTATAYNFRQPGKSMNKLKLWDNTIIIDDQEFLKKLIFKKRTKCGSSVLIFGDGSYIILEKDPHFVLLNLHHDYQCSQPF